MRVLILGGTGEARTLAAQLSGRPDTEVISSLAGRVQHPRLPVGETTVGGFGGPDGLATFIRDRDIAVLVDATHPFAARISGHAAIASAQTGVELITLRRPGWREQSGDHWIRVPDITAAAATAADLAPPGTGIFVTTGRRDLAAYASDERHHYLIRTVDPPIGPLPPDHVLALSRGPYDLAGELELIDAHAIAVLTSKDSGGDATRAKLAAARERGVPVVLIDRPRTPGPSVETVADVLVRVDAL